MVAVLPPSRAQLQRITGNDPNLLRALEELFRVAGNLLPNDVTSINASIAALDAAVSTLDGRTDITETDIAAIEAAIVALTAVVATKQAEDAGLTSLAGLSTVDRIYYLSAPDTWSAVTMGSGVTFTGGTLTASGGGGGGSITAATLTVPSSLGYAEVVLADAGVTATSKIIAGFAATIDEENDIESIADDMIGLFAVPEAGQVRFVFTSPGPFVGPYKVNYQVAA